VSLIRPVRVQVGSIAAVQTGVVHYDLHATRDLKVEGRPLPAHRRNRAQQRFWLRQGAGFCRCRLKERRVGPARSASIDKHQVEAVGP
jgi:hypothetical protein